MMAIPQMATIVAILVAKKTEHSIFRPLISWREMVLLRIFQQNLLNIALLTSSLDMMLYVLQQMLAEEY